MLCKSYSFDSCNSRSRNHPSLIKRLIMALITCNTLMSDD
uniref:Uncharacterized protein n=1 Tax=Arundo donax TaxID=35708 RepID=A0A0A9ATJ5_ARUDO